MIGVAAWTGPVSGTVLSVPLKAEIGVRSTLAVGSDRHLQGGAPW